MAAGADAVRDALVRAFGSVRIDEGYDPSTMETVFDFIAEDRYFTVRVSREFDADYAPGQLWVDLAQLGRFLRASTHGKATVRRSGISN